MPAGPISAYYSTAQHVTATSYRAKSPAILRSHARQPRCRARRLERLARRCIALTRHFSSSSPRHAPMYEAGHAKQCPRMISRDSKMPQLYQKQVTYATRQEPSPTHRRQVYRQYCHCLYHAFQPRFSSPPQHTPSSANFWLLF